MENVRKLSRRLRQDPDYSRVESASDPSTHFYPSYPPQLSEVQESTLISNAQDFQISHGSLLKAPPTSGRNLSRPIGVTLFPSLFPRRCFDEARMLQVRFNELYARVAEDEDWLFSVLQDLIRDDQLASALWGVHLAVKEEGYLQDLSLGIFRSDYMLHVTPSDQDLAPTVGLKQVEFNTYSCAGGSHSNIASRMHRYLFQTGSYDICPSLITLGSLPVCDNISSIVSGIGTAHFLYGSPKSSQATKTAVLFVVQPNNINICDERPIEYGLWDNSIPSYRVEFGEQILDQLSLSPTRELLYRPPSLSTSSAPLEISVVYLRAGYDVAEYDNAGRSSRILLEKSRAIKCPSILSHLTTFKKVQQALAAEISLGRFVSSPSTSELSMVFAPLYPLDKSPAGLHARKLALDPKTAVKHILKPNYEGGGHNIYYDDIPPFLRSTPEKQWHTFILMEAIQPPVDQSNVLIAPPQGTYEGSTVSELGIFGTCIWRRTKADDRRKYDEEEFRAEILENRQAGFSFKTKRWDIEEMSVVKGYGCFDSPCLVDL